MKNLYIKQIYLLDDGINVVLMGWVKEKRQHKKLVFLDITDSTGIIQVVANQKELTDECFDIFEKVDRESAVEISGKFSVNEKGKEIHAKSIKIIGGVTKEISPKPRSDFDIFDPSLSDHLLRNRHLYIRNPKILSILRFRHNLMAHTRNWFNENQFIEINAPILTPVPLYEDDSAIRVKVHDENVFLTQCVGYYLEAAVHGFERVYNMGPSFRNEETHSKRHLMEYWHIKAELTFGNREDIMSIVENMISYLTQKCSEDSHEIIKTIGRTKYVWMG